MLPFYFHDSGSSLLSWLWIFFQVDCLFPFHLFGLVGFNLAPSSVTYFFAISFFFFHEWDCVPVLLVVWPEASNPGVCRLLGRAGCWCWYGDLHATSLWWLFLGVWGSLLVQWFELGAPTAGASPQPQACKSRSRKPCGEAKKQKQKIK